MLCLKKSIFLDGKSIRKNPPNIFLKLIICISVKVKVPKVKSSHGEDTLANSIINVVIKSKAGAVLEATSVSPGQGKYILLRPQQYRRSNING